MKTNLKVITLILVIISSSIFVCCHDELEENGQMTAKNLDNFEGEICDGKKILKFDDLADLQQEHLVLYQQYMNNNEEEQTLVDYENSHSFYSLRKKEQDMDEGVIPVDPSFDEMNFTFDPILETLLNQDGMIIIGDRLYIWDSGCVIHSIPFSCSNYENLLAFYHAAQSGSTDAMHGIFVNNKMRNINICDDKYFDFEEISENGGRVQEGGVPKQKNNNNCGYEVVLNSKLISCDDGFYTYKVSPQTIAPLGSNPFNIYYIKPTTGEGENIEISTELLGNWGAITLGNEDELYGYIVPFNSDYFYMRIPDNTNPLLICDVTIYSAINDLSGNSCPAEYTIAGINNDCPFTIEAIKNYVSETTAQWTFSLNGANDCPIAGSKVKWVFGDGTEVEAGFTVTHTYSVPCAKQDITITATPNQAVCGVTDKLFTTQIPYGNPCTRDNYTFETDDDHEINGKKVKLKAKLRRNSFGKSIFKNVFKCRVNGSKTITSVGAIYHPSANNGSCVSGNISSVVPSKTTTGKKRNKQKEKFSTYYHINALNPYQVKFAHPDAPGGSFVLNPTFTCSH